MNEKSPVILDPGGGTPFGSPSGAGGRFKVGVENSAGSLTIFESHRPAGDPGGPALHKHAFDEGFCVLEGDYTIQVGERLVKASTGAFVYVPGGTIPPLRHDGDGGGRMLAVCSPGGIEDLFLAPDAEARAAPASKLGAEEVGPPLAGDA